MQLGVAALLRVLFDICSIKSFENMHGRLCWGWNEGVDFAPTCSLFTVAEELVWSVLLIEELVYSMVLKLCSRLRMLRSAAWLWSRLCCSLYELGNCY